MSSGSITPRSPTPCRSRPARSAAAPTAAGLLLLGVANFRSSGGSVDPAPAGYVTAHASLLPNRGSSETTASKEKAKSYDVPDKLAGTYELAGYRDEGGTPQLIYSDGRR